MDHKPTLKRLRDADPRAYAQFCETAGQQLTLKQLQITNPRGYAELCERAGCYSVALEFYVNSDSSLDLLHAAELADRLGNKTQRKKFSTLARQKVDSELEKALRAAQSSSAGENEERNFIIVTNRKRAVYNTSQVLLS
ncbi:MAG: hypothetical protein RL557_1042 [archaeon]|jgi:hypothetical protein